MSDNQSDIASDPSEPTPPFPGSRIQVVERSPERLAVYISGGGPNAHALGCFAVMWNGIVLVVSGGFLAAALHPNGPPWFVFAFLSLFWLIGLWLLYFAIRMKFERTMLLVEPTRAVLQRTLFQRVKTEDTQLTEGTSATLVESYSQNDSPVFAIHIPGVDSTLKIGTALSDREKDWLVERINEVLGVAPEAEDVPAIRIEFPESCTQCGGSLGPVEGQMTELTCPFCSHVHRGSVRSQQLGCESSEGSVDVASLPTITLEEHSVEQLAYSMRPVENSAGRWQIGGFLLFFGGLWNGIMWTVFFQVANFAGPGIARLGLMLFRIPFIVVGVGVILVALTVLFGRMRVSLNRRELAATWGVGPFRYTRRLPAEAIDRLAIWPDPQSGDSGRVRRRRTTKQMGHAAVAWAGGRWLPLSVLHSDETAKLVNRLVRQQFEAMKMPLEMS